MKGNFPQRQKWFDLFSEGGRIVVSQELQKEATIFAKEFVAMERGGRDDIFLPPKFELIFV